MEALRESVWRPCCGGWRWTGLGPSLICVRTCRAGFGWAVASHMQKCCGRELVSFQCMVGRGRGLSPKSDSAAGLMRAQTVCGVPSYLSQHSYCAHIPCTAVQWAGFSTWHICMHWHACVQGVVWTEAGAGLLSGWLPCAVAGGLRFPASFPMWRCRVACV